MEIKCPHCQTVFTVDKSEYAELLNQVKTNAIEEEVSRRLAEFQRTQSAEQKAALSDLARRKDSEISELNAKILKHDTEVQLAVMQAQRAAEDSLREKDKEIAALKTDAIMKEQIARNNEANLRDKYKNELAMKDEVIAQYKDFKARQSTKMIGESLEVYCNNQYRSLVQPYLPTAVFEKDNVAVENTKGDFIFRDVVDGMESVSIMFEMKNEADGTENKHKNSDHFKKLDSDRRKKNCEYAVLVSLLELDNDLYNNGIYAVPDYEKMYVVRPQQFLTIISLLVQTGRNTVKVKKELADAKNRDIDVTNFEAKIDRFKNVFGKHVADAAKRYNSALEDIDEAIKQLQNMREDLRLWVDHLYKAENNFDDITIRRLTSNNPTMKAKFDELKN